MHDFNQVGLIGHHLVNVLVGRWNFVHNATVLAALDAHRLLGQVLGGILPPGLGTAHAPARTMGAGTQCVPVTLAELFAIMTFAPCKLGPIIFRESRSSLVPGFG